MAEYIEREALNIAIHKSWQNNPHNDPIVRRTHNNEHRHFLGLLYKQPTADVVEVRHGEWRKQQFVGRSGFFSVKDFTCSNCFETFAVEQGKGLMNYCPNCGAKMGGKGEGV